jgi:hypothetical protein
MDLYRDDAGSGAVYTRDRVRQSTKVRAVTDRLRGLLHAHPLWTPAGAVDDLPPDALQSPLFAGDVPLAPADVAGGFASFSKSSIVRYCLNTIIIDNAAEAVSQSTIIDDAQKDGLLRYLRASKLNLSSKLNATGQPNFLSDDSQYRRFVPYTDFSSSMRLLTADEARFVDCVRAAVAYYRAVSAGRGGVASDAGPDDAELFDVHVSVFNKIFGVDALPIEPLRFIASAAQGGLSLDTPESVIVFIEDGPAHMAGLVVAMGLDVADMPALFR